MNEVSARVFARSTRREYWLCMVPYFVLTGVGLAVSSQPVLISALGLPVWLVIGIRRLHDIGVSGWWVWGAFALGGAVGAVKAVSGYHPAVVQAAAILLPLFNMAYFIVIGSLAGSRGTNRYGPPPRWRERSADIEAFD